MKAKARSSACSDKRTHLAHRLHEAVPPGAKLALCFDPEGDLSELESVLDDTGRVWRIVTYQEDDLTFRLTLRELEVGEWTADSPVLVRVAMPEFVPLDHCVELSFIGDVLSRVEGQPIDLRTDAVVRFHTESVTWPENLQDYAPRISQDLKGFVDGYNRLRAAIGRDRPLSHHHTPAVLLLAKSRDLDYRDLEVSQSYPAEVVARFLALTSVHQFNAEDECLLWEVLQATGHLDQNDQVKPWQEFPTEESLLLLVLSDFLEAHGVQNIALALSGLGLFSRPVHNLMPLLSQVRAHLKEQADLWPRLVQRADRACSPDQIERAVALLSAVCPPEHWSSLVRDGTPRMIAVALLLGYLDDRLTKSEAVRPLTLALSHQGQGQRTKG
jgi:hypothetical protein